MTGVLRKKKAEHGLFEDPWKQKIQCTLFPTCLVCELLHEGKLTGLKDMFPLDEWQVPPERRLPPSSTSAARGGIKTPLKNDPSRFDLISKTKTEVSGWVSVQVVSFRSDSADDASAWIQALGDARSALAATPQA
mmetsp:Transcript_7081/g.16211  ORF Transcript_7081/g.16211 Transcript_7081/m.16211 type:complete len:135 (+) Transcript_7081:62-466(+)